MQADGYVEQLLSADGFWARAKGQALAESVAAVEGVLRTHGF